MRPAPYPAACPPLELFYWPTPNGHKLTIFCEEAGLPYRLRPVNIGRGEQFATDFLRISPNNKIPALLDPAPADGGPPLAVFESGAILQYLAERWGRFLPASPRERYAVLQWLYWQVGGLGPMAGQNAHFSLYAPEPVPYAITRYRKETARLYAVLDRQLAGREFIAGEYSIADIACHPWIACHAAHGQELADFPALQDWFRRIAAREAVQRAYAAAATIGELTPLTEADWSMLFGQDAGSVRTI